MSLDNKYDSVFFKQVTAIGRKREQKDKMKKRTQQTRGGGCGGDSWKDRKCMPYRFIPPPS
jgi:hypothetical protein